MATTQDVTYIHKCDLCGYGKKTENKSADGEVFFEKALIGIVEVGNPKTHENGTERFYELLCINCADEIWRSIKSTIEGIVVSSGRKQEVK